MTVVAHLRPRAVLVENVPDLPSWDEGSVLMGLYDSLRDLGYTVDARVLDAYQYGVPQHRARLFLVGLRDCGAFEWPQLEDEITTLREAIGDLPPVPPAQRSDRIPYFGHRSTFQKRMREGVSPGDANVVHDHITRDLRSDDAEAFALLDEGQTYMDLPEHLRRYRSDIFTDKYKRLAWSEVSRSITAHIAKDGYWYIHPQQHRTLSVREAARIQTFPDWFRFAGQPTLRFRQIGNAVPPILAEALARRVRSSLQASPPTTPAETSDFRARLVEWHADHRRDYPWRSGKASPWLVLLGELGLSRTRADEIRTVYEQLKQVAPSPAALLALDDPGASLAAAGLSGARVEIIRSVARELETHFDGTVPEEELALRSLPGVGDNVAQAVRCFGFGRRAVLLDATTARLSERFFGRSDKRRWQIRLDLFRLAGAAGPDAKFNYALLDHGALVCRAESPRCEECPVSQLCAARGGIPGSAQLTLPTGTVSDAG
jgi:DNA (cytosine-5)-methyltransferase 1